MSNKLDRVNWKASKINNIKASNGSIGKDLYVDQKLKVKKTVKFQIEESEDEKGNDEDELV